jgi:hypothetical protein
MRLLPLVGISLGFLAGSLAAGCGAESCSDPTLHSGTYSIVEDGGSVPPSPVLNGGKVDVDLTAKKVTVRYGSSVAQFVIVDGAGGAQN